MDVDQHFRDSPEYELLEPYLDRDGRVAGYRIQRLLSRDRWRHTTYEARGRDGRIVALKLLHPYAAETRRAARRIHNCIRLRASIAHPHLLRILDWGKLRDQHYLVTAYRRDPLLRDLLKEGRRGAKGYLPLLAQLADALETAHDHGLVHRELVPESVLVSARGGGHVLLGDFGVANPELGSWLLDLTESVAYLSPEQLRDEPVTAASNVYSLACILVECLTGRPPYTGEDPSAVVYAHAAEPAPLLTERRPELPASLDAVVAAAMVKDPRERIQSPRRFMTAVTESLGIKPPPRRAKSGGTQAAPASASATASRNGGAPKQAKRLDRWGVAGSVAELGHAAAAARRQAGERLSTWRAGSAHASTTALRPAAGLVLAVLVIALGALGFAVSRSDDDDERGSQAAEAERALGAERERVARLQRIDAALSRLDTRRAVGRRRLAAAGSLRAQAAEARRIAAAYRSTARQLPRQAPAAAAVASRLERTRRSYLQLATAARRRSGRAYAAASAAVRRREGDLQQAIARLNDTPR